MPGLWLWYRGLAPPLPVWIPAFAGMTRWVAGTYPGSKSGTCFHSNRSCRLAPPHQSMKLRPGRWKCLGVVGATLPLWNPAPNRGAGHASDRRNDEFGGGNHSSRIGLRDMLSYQSLMPAGAATPRYENWVHWLMEGSGVVSAPHPTPSWGQAPALHPPLPTPLDSGFRRNDELRGRTDECGGGGILALLRLRNTIFVPMTRVGIYSRTNDTHETGPPKSEQLRVHDTA